MPSVSFCMKVFALVLVAALGAAVPAGAADRPRIVSVLPDAPALLDHALSLDIRARGGEVQGLRLSFPDLQGSFMESACRLPGGGQVARRTASGAIALRAPYQPSWAGLHLLELAVTSGGCGTERGVSRRSVPVEVAEAPASPPVPYPAAPVTGCAGADLLPLRARIRRLRLAVVCLLNAERRARGLRGLRTDRVLRDVASRQVHAMVGGSWFGHAGARTPGLRARLRRVGAPTRGAGEALGSAPSRLGTPRSIVGAWLASEPLARVLLDPRYRRVGAAAGVRVISPLPRSGGTYAVELGL